MELNCVVSKGLSFMQTSHSLFDTSLPSLMKRARGSSKLEHNSSDGQQDLGIYIRDPRLLKIL